MSTVGGLFFICLFVCLSSVINAEKLRHAETNDVLLFKAENEVYKSEGKEPKVVGCSDDVHYCPNGFSCDVSSNACVEGTQVIQWLTKTHAETVTTNVNGIICPGGSALCPESNTCCKLFSGAWGCCPRNKAVCCSDGVHCCPSGFICQVDDGTCITNSSLVDWVTTDSARDVIKNSDSTSIVCPGGNMVCPASCCKSSHGNEGCCKFGNGVCCSDDLQCCPSNTQCNMSYNTCLGAADVIEPGQTILTKDISVICPDGTSQCPIDNTCCKLTSGQYGCCPIPQMANAFTANPTQEICPDGHSCPIDHTCCKTVTGQYACCET